MEPRITELLRIEHHEGPAQHEAGPPQPVRRAPARKRVEAGQPDPRRRQMRHGEMDSGAESCGMVEGLIHDVPTYAALIGRIMSEAETIIQQRFARMLGTTGEA